MAVKKVRDKNRVPALLKNLKEYERSEVRVGIFKEDSEFILMIATVHEYGTNITVTPKMRAWFAYQGHPLKADTTEIKIPERSFMRAAWEDVQKKLEKQSKQAMKDIIDGKTAKYVLERFGELAVDEVKKYLHNVSRPPTSGLDNDRDPLVDSGNMVNSITYKIERR